jgi:hypothetical protein
MKRTLMGLLVLGVCFSVSPAAHAQFGGDFFHKPNIADIFHPVVGEGAVYENQRKDGTKSTLEMSIVGKEMADGKDAYWFEIGHPEKGSDQLRYMKMLVTKENFEIKRTIMVMPHSQQPMEFPINMSQKTKDKIEEEKEKWHQVGTEPVTVPAGTFLCQHWAKDDGTENVWVSSKISPMGLVKSGGKNANMVLIKTISGATTHITGTPQKMDLQTMMQQRMQQKKDQQ